jgi:hypothetical protein
MGDDASAAIGDPRIDSALADVQRVDAALAGLYAELVACLSLGPLPLPLPDGPDRPDRARLPVGWPACPADPPSKVGWRLTDRPADATLDEIRDIARAVMPPARADRLVELAVAHMRYTHRGCDRAYMHMAMPYFAGVWIADHVIDDVLRSAGFGADSDAVLAAMLAADPSILPAVAHRAELACGIGLVALCRSRLADVLTPEGVEASWRELRSWFTQIAPTEDGRSRTAAAQLDPARFVPYRTLNSGMPWVVLTAWCHRTRCGEPPPATLRALRCLAFATALYNDLVSIPEDTTSRAANGVLMLIACGRAATLHEAIDLAVAWYNRALVVLRRLVDEADDPVLADLCEGFVVGMAVWQTHEPKYAAGARALREHGTERRAARDV